MSDYLLAVWDVWLQLAPWLLLGAAIAGVLHVWLPAGFLRRQLSGRGSVAKAVALGVPLPLCSCGVIPVGLQLKKSGASPGAVVAFLTSTPQTGADSILVCASMLGWPLAVFKVLSAAATGLVGGWITNVSASHGPATLPIAEEDSQEAKHSYREIVTHGLELIHSIWGWLVVGVLVSAAITTWLPSTMLEGLSAYGGLTAMLVTLVISLPLYVCATASVPIAAALVAGGLPAGAALVFLMAGPATNTATLGAVYRALGRRALAIYLSTIIVGSVLCGWVFDSVIPQAAVEHIEGHEMTHWWNVGSAVLLLAILMFAAIQDTRRWWSHHFENSPTGPSLALNVSGMTCENCAAKLERSLLADTEISSARVSFESGRAVVHGDASQNHVREIVEQSGFRVEDRG